MEVKKCLIIETKKGNNSYTEAFVFTEPLTKEKIFKASGIELDDSDLGLFIERGYYDGRQALWDKLIDKLDNEGREYPTHEEAMEIEELSDYTEMQIIDNITEI